MSEDYRRSPGVAVVVGDTGDGDGPAPVYLAHLPNGPLVVLEGSAAAIWRAAAENRAGTGGTVVERVADELGIDPAEIGSDVEAFLGDLVAHGLLEPIPPGQDFGDSTV